MRVLVTGASGFICPALLRMLSRQGHEAVAVVRRREATVPGVATVVWDLGEAVRPANLPRNIDAIVHGAQSRQYRSFPADAAELLRVNVVGTWSLLDYAAETGVRRFCLLSSGTVYEPYRGALDEGAAVAPTSFLGATKLAAEVLARPYEGDSALCALRLFFPYGPGQKNRLVADIIERVQTGRSVQLNSDGDGPWIVPTFIDNIAEVITASVVEGWSGTINVASPEIVSLRQLAEMIGAIVGRHPVFELTDRQPLRITPTLRQLAARFDMSRFTPLQEALRTMIDVEAR